jgi:hypothetical protein
MSRARLMTGLLLAGLLPLGLLSAGPAAAATTDAKAAPRATATRPPAPVRAKAVMSQRAGMKHQRRVLFPFAPKASARSAVKPTGATAAASDALAAGAPVDVFATGGEVLGDTSVVVFWNPPAGGSNVYFVELHDAATGAQVGPIIAQDEFGFLCPQRTLFCAVFNANNGWPVVSGHSYFSIVTAGSSGGSTQSNPTVALFTLVPPPMASQQTFGCRCSSVSGRAQRIQGFVTDPVDTATGALTETATDLSLPGGRGDVGGDPLLHLVGYGQRVVGSWVGVRLRHPP